MDYIQKFNYMMQSSNEDGNFIVHAKRKQGQLHKNDEDAEAVADTYGSDLLFVRSFFTKDLIDIFPILARCFLQEEYKNIEKYDRIQYLTHDILSEEPTKSLNMRLLGIVLNASRQNSITAQELLRIAYKTYHKAEYNQLKRFKVLKKTDIDTLCGLGRYGDYDEDMDEDEECLIHLKSFYKMARILTIAPLFGIQMDKSCVLSYEFLNTCYETIQDDYEENLKNEQEAEQEELNAVDLLELHEIFTEKGKLLDDVSLKKCKKAVKYTNYLIEKFGLGENYQLYEIDEVEWKYSDLQEEIEEAYTNFKEKYPNQSITAETLQYYMVIEHLIHNFSDKIQDLNNFISMIFDTHSDLFNKEHFDFITEEDTQSKNKRIEEPVNKEIKEVKISGELSQELAELKAKVAEQKEIIKQIRSLYEEEKVKNEKIIKQQAQYEQEHGELIALRNHIYEATDSDMPQKEEDISEIKDRIKDKRIIIIGGHTNWLNKLKEEFPEWKFYPSNANSTINNNVLLEADMIFFFTDTLSHSGYYRFINKIQSQKLPFGYIHTVNIENNIRQIAKDLDKKAS